MRAAAWIAVLMVAGCGRAGSTKNGAAPSTPEEKLVAKWILDHADDPASVEFAKWGPNAKPGEYKFVDHAGGGVAAAQILADNAGTVGGEFPAMPATLKKSFPGHIVRVIYRDKNNAGVLIRKDILVFVTKEPAFKADNAFGDKWLESAGND